MKVCHTGELSTEEDVDLLKLSDLYGGLLLQNRHPVLKTYLERENTIYTGIREGLKRQPQSEKIVSRLAEVEEVLRWNGKARKLYK